MLRRPAVVGALLLAGVLASLGGALVTAGAAGAAGTITHGYSFSDPRSDMRSRPGEVDQALYGPYTVPANGMLANQLSSVPAPCTNCRITDIVPNLVFSDGSTANFANGQMLHHFVLLNPDASDLTCSTGPGALGERFFASGNERSHQHLPGTFGYPNSSSSWYLLGDFMNMTSSPQTVYVEVIFRHRALSETQSARPLWLDVNNCGDSNYAIPTGYSDTHWSWTSTVDGSFIGFGGHQHDLDHMISGCMTHCADKGGAVAISAELVGGNGSDYYGPNPTNRTPPTDLTGATMCRSEANYGTSFGTGNGYNGHLDTMSECGTFDDLPGSAQPEAYPATAGYPAEGYPIRKGQTIRLHSEYQNDTGAAIDDAMGIMMAWIAPYDAYARPKGASPLRASLVPAYRACTSPNRTHGPPLADPSCGPPVQESGQLTVGTPDANGAPAGSVGHLRLATIPGDPATASDESDVRIQVSISDVRRTDDLTDYTGELLLEQRLRVTDRGNGPGETGTTEDLTFPVTVPCTSSAGAGGATCAIATTADAVMPGSVSEGDRSIWQQGQLRVLDGGPDGVAATQDNGLFAVQGIFVP